jgi:membrane peptidoglycan carboxypeptidase
MLQQKVITPGEYRNAVHAPMPRPQDVHLSGVMGQSPYFGEYVKQQLLADRRIGPKRVYGGGFRVYTTIDLRLQMLARQAIDKWLPSSNGPQAALVALNPSTGDVLAMYGGRSFHASQFNLAVQGERQPGSSFKPFVLATALKEGISPLSIFDSHPVSIFLGNRYWTPSNYEGEYLGPINLVKAIAVSDNSVFAQLTKVVGPANVAREAHALGITSPLDGVFSIGLGTQAVNPLEMARAYSTFANGGLRVDGRVFGNEPRAVTEIKDDSGNVIYNNKPVGRRVMSTTDAEVVNQLLQGVVTGGTGTAAALPDRPVAGKTGTTENYGDAWFVGYTPQLVTAVWVGYPKGLRPMLSEWHGGPVVGGTFPASIWKTFMQSALKLLGAQPEGFASPPYLSVDTKRVTYRDGRVELDNGRCHSVSLLVYFVGEGPRRTADCKVNEVDVPSVIGYNLAAARSRLSAQPLTAQVIYRPANAGERVGVVVKQIPRRGTLSSFQRVTIVLAKPLHGTVPRIVGLPWSRASAKLRKLKLSVRLQRSKGAPGRVVDQKPRGGVAAAPGMKVTVTVGIAG